MQVSKEELLHIANLADIIIDESEIDTYLVNLQDILNFANIVNKTNVEHVEETFTTNDNSNIFRKDDVSIFDNIEDLIQNAPEQEDNMFKIPKVIN